MRLIALLVVGVLLTGCATFEGTCDKTKHYSRVLVGVSGPQDAAAKAKIEEEVARVLEQRLRVYAVPESRVYTKPYVLEGPTRAALLIEHSLEATLRVHVDADRLNFEVVELNGTEPAWRADAVVPSTTSREDAIQAALGEKLKLVASCEASSTTTAPRTRHWGDYSPGDF